MSEKKLKGQWIQPSEGNSPQLTKGGKLRKNSKSSRELARPQLVSSPIVPQGSRTCLTHGGNSVHTVEWTSEWLGEGGNRSHRGLQPERREGKTHSQLTASHIPCHFQPPGFCAPSSRCLEYSIVVRLRAVEPDCLGSNLRLTTYSLVPAKSPNWLWASVPSQIKWRQ